MNRILMFGAILGLVSVIIAAYIDHGLAPYLTKNSLRSVSTALRYHQFYAATISMIGLILPLQRVGNMQRLMLVAGYLFIIGTVLFSFSIYIAIISGNNGILFVTPIGGFVLMAGWGCLIAAGFTKRDSIVRNLARK